jgi:O-antigen ligase
MLLIAYFACGAVAALIGSGSDLYFIARDSVLVGYAVVIWLVAATLRTRADMELLLDVMFWAGVAAMVVWAAGIRYPKVALGVYAAFAYLPILVAWADGRRVALWKLAVVGVGLTYLVAFQVRTSWVAFAAALLVLSLSRPRRLGRVRLAALLSTALVVAFAWLVLPSLTDTSLGKSLAGIRPGTEGYQASNSTFRLEYWRYELDAVAKAPLGKGFGPPSNFCSGLSGECLDDRTSHTGNDVAGPHNSYVNVAYRVGVQGIAVLIALLVAIVVPAWRAVRRTGDPAIRTALVMLTFSGVSAGFAVSLEGPYMAVPFWALLGLIVVLTQSHAAAKPEKHGREDKQADPEDQEDGNSATTAFTPRLGWLRL